MNVEGGPQRCPRSDDDIVALLALLPDGWEYRLYGGVMYVEQEKLEQLYHDYILGFVERHGDPLTATEALREAEAAFADAQAIAAMISRMMTAEHNERAFGPQGTAGDPAVIRHFAKRTVDGYGMLMRWAQYLRGLRVPEEFHEVMEAAANLMRLPVEQCREFMRRVVTQMDKLDELMALADDDEEATVESPMVVELTLTLSIDPRDVQALEDALKQAPGRFEP